MRCLTIVFCYGGLLLSAFSQPTNQSKSATTIQFGLTETVASGWVPPTTWKMVYDKPVVESEVSLQINTPSWTLLRATKLSVWIQNPTSEPELFTPPSGEVDYALCLTGPAMHRLTPSFEIRFIDVGSLGGADVGTFGDNDFLRLRTKLDYPFNFLDSNNTVITSLTFFHVEPVSFRPKVAGNVVCFQVSDEWKPLPWIKMSVNAGFLHDWGVSGGIEADVASVGIGAGVRLAKFCWVTGSMQNYNTLGHPSNRPKTDFNQFVGSVSLKL